MDTSAGAVCSSGGPPTSASRHRHNLLVSPQVCYVPVHLLHLNFSDGHLREFRLKRTVSHSNGLDGWGERRVLISYIVAALFAPYWERGAKRWFCCHTVWILEGNPSKPGVWRVGFVCGPGGGSDSSWRRVVVAECGRSGRCGCVLPRQGMDVSTSFLCRVELKR